MGETHTLLLILIWTYTLCLGCTGRQVCNCLGEWEKKYMCVSMDHIQQHPWKNSDPKKKKMAKRRRKRKKVDLKDWPRPSGSIKVNQIKRGLMGPGGRCGVLGWATPPIPQRDQASGMAVGGGGEHGTWFVGHAKYHPGYYKSIYPAPSPPQPAPLAPPRASQKYLWDALAILDDDDDGDDGTWLIFHAILSSPPPRTQARETHGNQRRGGGRNLKSYRTLSTS